MFSFLGREVSAWLAKHDWQIDFQSSSSRCVYCSHIAKVTCGEMQLTTEIKKVWEWRRCHCLEIRMWMYSMYAGLPSIELFNFFADITLLSCLKELVLDWCSSPNAQCHLLHKSNLWLHVAQVQSQYWVYTCFIKGLCKIIVNRG